MTMKRFLAILLTIMMLVQAMPLGALAEATVVSNVLEGAEYHDVTFNVAETDADNNAVLDSNGDISLVERATQLVEDGKAAVVPDVPDVNGYSFEGWASDVEGSTTSAVTADTNFDAQYAPIEYHTVTVNYVYEDNTAVRQSLVYDFDSSKEYDALEIPVEDITGFTVTAADEKGGAVVIDGGKFSVNVSKLAEDKTYTVKYIGAEVAYTVNHYYQEIDGTYGDPLTKSKTGKAGTMTAATAESKTGFTAPADEDIVQKRISPKGDTVVDIYYTRNTYKLNFYTDSGTYVDNEILPYGTPVKLPAVTKAGHSFLGWDADGNDTTYEYAAEAEFNMPAMDISLEAVWSENDSASYTVVYWQQSKNDKWNAKTKTYDYVTSKSGSGVPGATTSYEQLSESELTDYNYCTLNTSTSLNTTIAADGSTVVNVYYDRNVMTLQFNKDGESYKTLKGLYGQSFSQAEAEWPFEYKWTQSGTQTTMTFMDAFVMQNSFSYNSNLTYTFNAGTQNTGVIKHFLQKVDGTWPSEDNEGDAKYIRTVYGNTSNSLTLNNKFEGFVVTYFRHTTCSSDGWYGCDYGDHEWRQSSAGKSAGNISHGIEIRHIRLAYDLSFEGCKADVEALATQSVPYEKVISEYKPTTPADISAWRPDGMDSEFTFAGWYFDDGYTKPVDWNYEMPTHNVRLFARWLPPVKTVTYHYNDDTTEDLVFNVYKGDTLKAHHYSEVDGEPVYSNTQNSYDNIPAAKLADTATHTFAGWYTDEALTKPLDENFAKGTTQIAKNWDIYAKWVSTEEEEVVGSLVTVNEEVITEYVDKDGNPIQITEDMLPSASGVIGETVTLEAPEIPGYVPVDKYVTYTITEDGDNKVKIVYTKLDTWTLTVKYQDEDGNELADPVKHANLTTDSKAVTYKVIPGGTEQQEIDDVKYDVKYMWQATDRILIADKPEANDEGVKETTLTFVYKKVTQVPYYIEHYVEGPVGSYSVKETDGPLFQWKGYTATASKDNNAKDYSADNLAFNEGHVKNKLSITVVVDAALMMYYDLQVANYTVKHFQENVDGEGYTEVVADEEIKSGTIGDKTAAEAKTYTGFTALAFEQKTIAADGSTVVEIYYDRNAYSYVINHVEKGNEENVLAEATTGTANFGEVIKVADKKKTIEGFNYDSNSGDITIAVEGNEATIYYSRNSYNVTYAYTGTVPANASDLPADASYKYGAAVTVADDATAEGFAFSGWSKDDFTMPAENVEITGSFSRDFVNYDFKVEPYVGQYDADAHGVTVSGLYEGDVVEYKTEDGEWVSELKYTDVGEYIVSVRVSNAIGV